MANLVNPLANSQDFSSSYFNAAIDNIRSTVFQTADASVTNSALLTQSADLTMPITPGAKYAVEACLFYDTDATSDMRFGIIFPGLSVVTIAGWHATTAATGVTNNITSSVYGSEPFGQSAFFSAGGVASGTVMCIRPVGFAKIDDLVSGVVYVNYSQDTATASRSIFKQGSWLSLTRLG